jgi:hypothetical protein
MTKTAKPVAPKKLVLNRESVRTLNEPVSAENAYTTCPCYSRCTCTTNLC